MYFRCPELNNTSTAHGQQSLPICHSTRYLRVFGSYSVELLYKWDIVGILIPEHPHPPSFSRLDRREDRLSGWNQGWVPLLIIDGGG